ncbi:hemin uptake protein HemP [uncultured Devosia sp.]|uniref:hemin uptake protein HemP n=1 Tax=uncultured Devosia sp. TaxID=211434 RepID=UPI0035CB853D
MADSDSSARTATISPRLIDSATLFDGANELIILHNGTPYRLRITRQDKLILTK